MKFRVKHIPNIGHFAQVYHGWISGWQTIGKHPNGYGLYSEDHLDYPLESNGLALSRCHNYKRWHRESKGIANYTEYSI